MLLHCFISFVEAKYTDNHYPNRITYWISKALCEKKTLMEKYLVYKKKKKKETNPHCVSRCYLNPIICFMYKNSKFLHPNPWNKVIIPSSVPILITT